MPPIDITGRLQAQFRQQTRCIYLVWTEIFETSEEDMFPSRGFQLTEKIEASVSGGNLQDGQVSWQSVCSYTWTQVYDSLNDFTIVKFEVQHRHITLYILCRHYVMTFGVNFIIFIHGIEYVSLHGQGWRWGSLHWVVKARHVGFDSRICYKILSLFFVSPLSILVQTVYNLIHHYSKATRCTIENTPLS